LSISQNSQKIKIDASAMIDTNGWPREGFQATRVRLAEAIDTASTEQERLAAIDAWNAWASDEIERFRFGCRSMAARYPGNLRDCILDVIADSVAEAIELATSGEATRER
jgi:hypothetical protein